MLMVAKDRKDLENVDVVYGPVAKSLGIDLDFVVEWCHWKDDGVVAAAAAEGSHKDDRREGMLWCLSE
jgi:hypothetical protein